METVKDKLVIKLIFYVDGIYSIETAVISNKLRAFKERINKAKRCRLAICSASENRQKLCRPD